MKFINQLLIILIVSFIGEAFYFILPFPIPSGIYGLIVMFILLLSKIIKIEQIQDTGLFLIEIMPLMFISPVAGLIGTWRELKEILLPFVLIILSSTIVVMAVSGKITQKLIKLGSKK